MSYWKCSRQVFFTPIMTILSKPLNRNDNQMLVRECIFLKLLSYCSDGYVFSDHEHATRVLDLPHIQCKRVWELCEEHNILRECPGGYSANDWMSEKGLLFCGKIETKSKHQCRSKNDSNDKTAKTTPQKQLFNDKRVVQDIKRAVRPNVFLRQDEIDSLRSRFSDEQINLMLDRLSSYKSQSQRNYQSDMQAIERWVIKWLSDSNHERETTSEKPQNDFPDWITGG